MGFFHKLNDQDYIITDSDGEISAIGRKVSELLKLEPSQIMKNRINI
jgi:hypothetical protein